MIASGRRFRALWGLLVLALAATTLSACGKSSTPEPTQSPVPTVQVAPPPTRPPLANSPAAQAAVTALASRLAVDRTLITVRDVTPTQWPDACLDVELPGQLCAEVITQGFIVVLQAPVLSVTAQQFEYHTNQDGSAVVPEQAIHWHREGGIAGFCDDLIIDVTGLASAYSCVGDDNHPVGASQMLDDAHRMQLYTWLSVLRPIEYEQNDESQGQADYLLLQLSFGGYGLLEAGDELLMQMTAWSQDVFNQVTTQ